MRETLLPFSRPSLGEEEISEVVDVLRSGWITSGPRVKRFEQAFCERLGVEHAVAVCSATAGLHLALATLDLRAEDEVIVPSLTWASTANVVELCGAKTVFADVDPGTLCMDPVDAKRRITARTRAIIPVHFAGQAVDLDAFRELARAHSLDLVQDAAHALGTAYRGQEIGSTGELAVFSFHPIKNITTAEGGMVVLSDAKRAERLRLLRFHGVSKNAWKRHEGGGKARYEVVEPGWKYNLTDLQAALGIHQLAKLDGFNARRRELGLRYEALLADVPEVTPLERVTYPGKHAWHLFVVRLDLETSPLDRDSFMGALEARKIGTGLHFPALHSMPYFRRRYGYEPGSLPHSELAGESILSLPLYPSLTDSEQDEVVDAICAVLFETGR